MTNELETRRRRAAYRAKHRGTKEMDWLLGRFADARIAGMRESELAVFERFIALPDPELHGWITDPETLDRGEWDVLVLALREFHGV